MRTIAFLLTFKIIHKENGPFGLLFLTDADVFLLFSLLHSVYSKDEEEEEEEKVFSMFEESKSDTREYIFSFLFLLNNFCLQAHWSL